MDQNQPAPIKLTGVVASANWAEKTLLYVNLSVHNRQTTGEHRIFSGLMRCRFRGREDQLAKIWESVGFGNYVSVTGSSCLDAYGSFLLNADNIILHQKLEELEPA